jgi:hypothetical protein
MKRLPSPHSGARRGVGRRAAIDVDLDSRICRLIRSREGYQRARITIPTISDTHLSTRDVELCSVCVACLVQSDMLDTKEVITTRGIFRNGHTDGSLV